jgi:hypothetical protein
MSTKNFIEGKVAGKRELTGRRGRRCTQILDDPKEIIRYGS